MRDWPLYSKWRKEGDTICLTTQDVPASNAQEELGNAAPTVQSIGAAYNCAKCGCRIVPEQDHNAALAAEREKFSSYVITVAKQEGELVDLLDQIKDIEPKLSRLIDDALAKVNK
jgi:hypothetical protein